MISVRIKELEDDGHTFNEEIYTIKEIPVIVNNILSESKNSEIVIIPTGFSIQSYYILHKRLNGVSL